MGQPGAYLHIGRCEHDVRPAEVAVHDFDDIVVDLAIDGQRAQASRCMNCGVPFCQSGVAFSGTRKATGCPLHNLIPETNDLLFHGRMDEAASRLNLTNPFPEFTGRVCPAPCEVACNLGLHDDAVTIHDDERAISDYAWECGIDPLPTPSSEAPLVSIIGSGPAGLAAAWELARTGHRVRVYERADRPGGLLMYGIPSMKLPKQIVERRIDLMKRSGIEFVCGVDAAEIADEIMGASAAVIVAVGSRTPRRVDVPGAELSGIHFAVDYLTEVTRTLLDGDDAAIDASGKDVVVIGGGDTGVDCVACALRQGAKSVKQVIRALCPPTEVAVELAWPGPRDVYGQAYGQREAAEILGEDPRLWSTDTCEFVTADGQNVSGVIVQDISYENGRHNVEGTEQELPAQLVLIAKGFTGPESRVMEAFGISGSEDAGSVRASSAAGACPVYVAGDAHLGPTIVASAMADALEVARQVVCDIS